MPMPTCPHRVRSTWRTRLVASCRVGRQLARSSPVQVHILFCQIQNSFCAAAAAVSCDRSYVYVAWSKNCKVEPSRAYLRDSRVSPGLSLGSVWPSGYILPGLFMQPPVFLRHTKREAKMGALYIHGGRIQKIRGIVYDSGSSIYGI